jgi:hypothetical protein
MVADPFHLLDCAMTAEGAAALLVTTRERAADITDRPVHILGAGLDRFGPAYQHPPSFDAGPGDPDPPVFPFPPDPRLWIFQSTYFYGTPTALGAALSEAGLDALEAAHGLFVGHTYLGASARTTRDPEHLASLAVRPAPGGGLEIDPALDAGLERAARRVRAGSLATLTLREAGDRLRALASVRVVYLADGGARVENHGEAAVSALQLELLGEAALEVEGPEAGGHVRGDGHAHVWFDLGPGQAAEVHARGADGPLPFLAADPGATLAP